MPERGANLLREINAALRMLLHRAFRYGKVSMRETNMAARERSTMKRVVFFAVCVLISLLLCSCKPKEQNNMNPSNAKTVTFVNEVREADVWILPETAANLKTTVWGTAVIAKAPVGEARTAPLDPPGDEGHYIFRMIDADHFYYSANGITLEDGWTLTVRGSDLHSVSLEVLDSAGALQQKYEVFAARL